VYGRLYWNTYFRSRVAISLQIWASGIESISRAKTLSSSDNSAMHIMETEIADELSIRRMYVGLPWKRWKPFWLTLDLRGFGIMEEQNICYSTVCVCVCVCEAYPELRSPGGSAPPWLDPNHVAALLYHRCQEKKNALCSCA